MIIVAVLAGLTAGAWFAVGGVLLQREVRSRPESESLSPRLLLELIRRPAWSAGIGPTARSFLFIIVDTSPLVRRVQRVEARQRQETSQEAGNSEGDR